jgi:uncharacterized protein (DUF427 family)
MKAIWNNTVIAQSDDITEVEGNAYFPMSSLNTEYVVASATHTSCAWKGTASYFSIRVGDATNVDAAWYYPTPKSAASAVADRVAFWRGIKVVP